MSVRKSPKEAEKEASESEKTVVLLGIATMLLMAVIYVWLDLPPAVVSSE